MPNSFKPSRHINRLRDFVKGEAVLLSGIVLVSGLILLFLRLADEVVEGETQAFDQSILLLFRDPANVNQLIGPSWVHEAVRDVTSIGSFSILGLLVIGIVIYLLLTNRRAIALFALASVLGGTAISTLLKLTYNRPRPDLTTMSQQFTSSFPSGHAMLSAVTFLTLGAILSQLAPTRALRIYAIASAIFLTVLVGVSRVYMGVHFPSDVLAGWCLGAAWALACSIIAYWLQQRRKVAPSTINPINPVIRPHER